MAICHKQASSHVHHSLTRNQSTKPLQSSTLTEKRADTHVYVQALISHTT